jgi:MFS transporter, MHS family, proline/betaine transporter
MIGNILEHYDNALFGLLAPFIAPLFFESSDPLTALILTYTILPLGILARPLGSLFFGWIGDRFGRRQALFCSMGAIALLTLCLGCLPTYAEVGMLAPLALALIRMGQNFCAAGEVVGGAIYVLENTHKSRRTLMSSLYDVSSMGGILIASGAVTYFSYKGIMQESWRQLFFAGGATALFGLFLRFRGLEGEEFLKSTRQKSLSTLDVIKNHKGVLLSIILVSGFAYTTYSLPFTLMNGFVPLVTSLTKADAMKVNTLLLLADLCLLPCFGLLAMRFGKERLMILSALLAALLALPLFCLLRLDTMFIVTLVRFIIVALGVAFFASYHAWTLERIAPQHRFTILSLGYALGSQLIGSPTSAVSLWLYQKTGWLFAPGLYLLVTGSAAAAVVLYHAKKSVAATAKT